MVNGEPEESHRAFWHIPVGYPVAEDPEPGEGSGMPDEGLEMRKPRPGRSWSRGGRGALKCPEESVPVHSSPATNPALSRREEVVGPTHQLFL